MVGGPVVAHTDGMREPLITATLLSIYVGSRSGALAIGALQRLAR